ncbi:hypothetical protein EDB81DRAFT_301374 [Dactylonectria macrodidyma]|uniref:DUF5597 domain-containing protein n=1 Tax=Dactylonectria macrodidyma TaxID=307937 RepID=A0A9P9D7T9_9HYPO|nr:hypothetical protein EDB81DRAFT_301374 [Dactylonectria macrodidyma]
MFGFYFDERNLDGGLRSHEKWSRTIGGYELTVTRPFVFGMPGPGYGIIIYQGANKFLLIGAGLRSRSRARLGSVYTGILKVQEKQVGTDGVLSNGRLLNRDERRCGEFAIMPSDNCEGTIM